MVLMPTTHQIFPRLPVARTGRNPKFDAALKQKFVDLLRAGNFRLPSAKACGINPFTYRYHIRKDEKFRDEVLKAEADAEIIVLNKLLMAAEKAPAYYAWFLERKYPERWLMHKNEIKELLKRVEELKNEISSLSQERDKQTAKRIIESDE